VIGLLSGAVGVDDRVASPEGIIAGVLQPMSAIEVVGLLVSQGCARLPSTRRSCKVRAERVSPTDGSRTFDGTATDRAMRLDRPIWILPNSTFIHAGAFPKLAGNLDRVDSEPFPPRSLVAGTMDRAVMQPT
jgi:hypothetical protein